MSSSSGSAASFREGHFLTTHWSVVCSAQSLDEEKSREALECLCRAYWYPLYGYARRLGNSPADAEDLTQGFFARLLEKDYLKAAAREKGRFRTFLLTALKAYMANEWDRQHAKKRGGFAVSIPIDQELAETKLTVESPQTLSPDVLFDRHWAIALLDQTLSILRDEYTATGRAHLFEHLQVYFARSEAGLSYAEMAKQLNLTQAAVKMAVHRMRSRYRDLLRDRIAHTVSSPEEIEQEIRHLFASF